MSKKKKYKNGDIFIFPLRTEGYSAGIIARHHKGCILGYFINKKYKFVPNIESVKEEFEKREIIFVKRFSEMGLKKQEWVVIGCLEDFKLEDWINPEFKREVTLLEKTFFAVQYGETLDTGSETKRKITEEESLNMPEDGLAGYGFIELKMTKLLENHFFL
jgi:hypothetical protein